MGRGCRDCEDCTEMTILYLMRLPFRVVWSLLTFWNIGLFRRRCPQCRHLLRRHHKVRGRFAD